MTGILAPATTVFALTHIKCVEKNWVVCITDMDVY